MTARQSHEALYLANATVLLTHQVDAAYWHEWELFGMPGGVELFLLLNLPIVLLVLLGARAVALGRASGAVLSWVLVASGFVAVGLHAVFLSRGHEAFGTPVSLGLLAATLVLSTAQAVAAVRCSRAPVAPSARRVATPARS